MPTVLSLRLYGCAPAWPWVNSWRSSPSTACVALPVIPVRGRHRDTGSGDATCSLRLVDPHRGGDLPRTIVIRADGSRTAISGELTEKQLAQIAP
jgi:hypothetical protein